MSELYTTSLKFILEMQRCLIKEKSTLQDAQVY